MGNKTTPIKIHSISELHQLLGLPKPLHPLISLIKMGDLTHSNRKDEVSFCFDFYGISLKRNFKGKLKYGQNYYDFDEGVLGMTSPQQVLSVNSDDNYEVSWIFRSKLNTLFRFKLNS